MHHPRREADRGIRSTLAVARNYPAIDRRPVDLAHSQSRGRTPHGSAEQPCVYRSPLEHGKDRGIAPSGRRHLWRHQRRQQYFGSPGWLGIGRRLWRFYRPPGDAAQRGCASLPRVSTCPQSRLQLCPRSLRATPTPNPTQPVIVSEPVPVYSEAARSGRIRSTSG